MSITHKLNKINKNNEISSKNMFPLHDEYATRGDLVKIIPPPNINNNYCHIRKLRQESLHPIFTHPYLNISSILINKGIIFIAGTFTQNIEINGKKFKTLKITNAPNPDIFIAGLDKDHRIFFIKSVPGIGSDTINSMCLYKNELYICGSFTDSITFDSVYLSVNHDKPTMYAAKMSLYTYEWVWAYQISETYDKTVGNNIRINRQGQVEIFADYYGKIVFDTIPKTEYGQDSKVGKDSTKLLITLNRDNGKLYNTIDGINGTIISFQGGCLAGVENMNLYLGNPSWKLIPDPNSGPSIITDIIAQNPEEIYIVGEYIRHLAFGTKVLNGIKKNVRNVFVAKVKSQNVEWLSHINTKEDMTATGIEMDEQNNIIITGSIEDKKGYIAMFDSEGNEFLRKTLDSGANPKNVVEYDNIIYILTTENEIVKYIRDDRIGENIGIITSDGFFNKGDKVAVIFKNGEISGAFDEIFDAGYKYYVQKDGTLDTKSTPFYFGTAVSFSKLLI